MEIVHLYPPSFRDDETEVGKAPEGTRLLHATHFLEAAMQLHYRGASYDHDLAHTPIDVPTSDLRYRGTTYRHQETRRAEALRAILKYRGMSYQA